MERRRRLPLSSNYPLDVVIHIPACLVSSGLCCTGFAAKHWVGWRTDHRNHYAGEHLKTTKCCLTGWPLKRMVPLPAFHAALYNQLLIKVAFWNWNSKTRLSHLSTFLSVLFVQLPFDAFAYDGWCVLKFYRCVSQIFRGFWWIIKIIIPLY